MKGSGALNTCTEVWVTSRTTNAKFELKPANHLGPGCEGHGTGGAADVVWWPGPHSLPLQAAFFQPP